MNSGCICCSLVGDFGRALKKVLAEYAPDRILIEPSGVGKLSDVIGAVERIDSHDIALNSFTTVVDAKKAKVYMKNFGEFFNNQVESASAIILSRTQDVNEAKLSEVLSLLREHNPNAIIITTPWSELSGQTILSAMERKDTLAAALQELSEMARKEEEEEEHEHHHHHHHDEDECDDPECECHHHHHDDDDDDDHEHHHHHHDDDEECDDPECECHHHHDHDHDADEVFTSFGMETSEKFTVGFIEDCLDELMTGRYGMVLRAKGIVSSESGEWLHFDYVPGEKEIRVGSAEVIGKLCVIGTGLDKKGLTALFTREK
jgi:G3E family GTPase